MMKRLPETDPDEMEMDGGKIQNGSQNDHQHPFLLYKILKQLLCCSMWISIGFSYMIVGPTIPDLRLYLGYTYEEISRGLAARSAGLFIGGIVGGILHDLYPRHSEIIIAVAITFSAIANLFIPVITSLPLLAFVMWVSGLSPFIINTGAMPMVLELWRDKASGPMHSIHFAFGLGAVLSPFIAEPFLSHTMLPEDGSSSNYTTQEWVTSTTQTGMTTAYNSSNTTLRELTNQLMYPYGITSGILFLVAASLTVFYIKGPPKGFRLRDPPDSIIKLINPSSCFPGHPGYSTGILILLFFFFFHATAGEHTYATFIFSYALEVSDHFDKPKAALLTSAFWAAFVAGRFSGIFISQLVRPEYIITAGLSSSLVIFICLTVIPSTHEYSLWILTILAGYVTSMLFASGILWGHKHINMNGMANMVCMCGCSIGLIVYMYFTGYMFDAYGIQSFGYVLIFYVGCYILVFVAMQIVTLKCGKSYTPQAVAQVDYDLADEDDYEDDDDVVETGHSL